MILNVITMISCFFLLMVFRRLDKSNAKMAKLRRYAKKSYDDFKKLADDEGRKFRDATIEMDILIKKSDTLTTNLSRSLVEIESRIKGIEMERENLGQIGNEIKAIANTASELDQHIQFIESAGKEFKGMSKNIAGLQEDIESVKGNAGKLITTFESRLKERSREMTEEIHQVLDHFRQTIQEREEQVMFDSGRRIEEIQESFTGSLNTMELQLSNTADAVVNRVTSRVDQIERTLEEAAELTFRINTFKEMLGNLENRAFSDIKKKSDELKEYISAAMEAYDEKTAQTERMMKEFIAEMGNSRDDIMRESSDELQIMKNELSASMALVAEKNAELSLMVNESLESIESTKEKIVEDLIEEEEKVRREFNEVSESLSGQLAELSREIEGNKKEIFLGISREADSVRDDMLTMKENIVASLKEKSKDAVGEIQSAISGFDEKKKILIDGVSMEIERMHEKIKSAETTITTTRQQIIKTFEQEVDRVKSELDNLSMHAISKKDEIVQAARKEAETIRANIEDFEDKYEKIESRLMSVADTRMSSLDSEFQVMELRLSKIMEMLGKKENETEARMESIVAGARNDFSSMEQRLVEIKNAVVEYEEKNRVFSRTDELIDHVSASITNLRELLERTEKDVSEVREFQSAIDEFKEARKELDRELRLFQNKKETISNIEAEIQGLLQLADIATERSEQASKSVDKIERFSDQIEKLAKRHDGLQASIAELQEYEEIISNNLQSAAKSEQITELLEKRLGNFSKEIDKTDKKVERMTQHLKTIEESTIILKTREREIKAVQDKFNEIDGLSDHVEERVGQIYAMIQKVERLREDLEVTDTRLKEMFQETDTRMKQFADFIEAVDENNPIIKEVKPGLKVDKKINRNVMKTVRELSDKGWTARDISDKMMLDENSVRLIINTTSM